MKKPRAPRRAPRAPAAPPAGARAPSYEDLLAIARLVESGSRFSEFRLRSGDIEVEVKRALPAGAAPANAMPAPAAPAAQPAAPAPAAAIPELPAGTKLVLSPMAGTVYRSPLPGEPHFVDAGSKVVPDTVVCIVEVMKLMNSIPAGHAGVVSHVFVENAQPVEPGQPLFAIKKAR